MNTFFVFADAEIAARHDPTWVYSTLAQTAGALVGILGGVLINRTIAQMQGAREAVADVRNQIQAVLGTVHENLQTILPRLDHQPLGPSGLAWYASIADRHQKLQKQLIGEVDRRRLPEYVAVLRECTDTFPPDATPALHSNDMRPAITGNITHLEQLSYQLVALDGHLNPLSLRFVLCLLVFLSLVGVAWPMAELWVLTDQATIRMVVLAGLFVAGVLALVGYFAYLLVELHRLGRFHWVRL